MDGFEIPIGGDFSGLQDAMNRIAAEMSKMGQTISAAMDRSNEAFAQAAANLGRVQSGTVAVATAADGTGKKLMTVARGAIALGSSIGNVTAAMGHMASIMTALSGNNFGTMLANVARIGKGLKSVFTSIWGAMTKLGESKSLFKIAAGAAAGVAAVLLLRQAFRTVMGSINLLKNSAAAVFHGMVAAAKSAARAITGAFSGIASLPGKMLSSPALPIAGILSAVGMIGLAFKSIGKAADMETLETAFAPLLGGADAAKARIAELAEFAAATPFELPEVAKASRTLQTLTQGALATGDGLRLVGDVAAGVGGSFDEISVTIGRLYDGLNNGRPVGEAMMRLQELGVISGATRSQIEDLQESGASGAGVWNVAAAALGKFGGSMERQSRTWNGKLSTFMDTVSMVMAEFGKPIVDALKPWLDMAIEKIETLKVKALEMGDAVRNVFDVAMGAWQTGNIAEVIGAGLPLAIIDGVNLFSSGIRKTMAYLGEAMTEIMASAKDSWGAQEFLGILMDVGKGLASMITSAILKGIDAVPGIDVTEDVKREANAGANSFRRAGNRIADFNGAAAMQGLVDALNRMDERGKAAAAGAGNDNVIDRAAAAEQFDKVMQPIRDWIVKQKASIDASNKAIDDKLKKSGGADPGRDSPQKVAHNSVAPAVMSLTRIGGGGFGNAVRNGQLSEAKKQTSLLQKGNILLERLYNKDNSRLGTFA